MTKSCHFLINFEKKVDFKFCYDFMQMSQCYSFCFSVHIKRAICRLISIQKFSYYRCYLLQIKQKYVLLIYAGAKTPVKQASARYSCYKTISLFQDSQEENSKCPDLIKDHDRAYTLIFSTDSLVLTRWGIMF